MRPPAPAGPAIVIAGGGTGGHLFPGLALAEELTARGAVVTFVGTAAGIEARVVPRAGFPLRLVPGRQLRGGGPGRALRGLAAALAGARRSRALLRELAPRLVVGVGGYASVAAVLAARSAGIPTLLLEQNAVPGAANRLLGRLAARVCVGFAAAVGFFPRGRAVHTGNPVRRDILRAGSGPRPPRLGLLVFGGSQGAHRLNQAMLAAARLLGPELSEVAIVHQTGSADRAEVAQGYAALGLAARVEAFIEDMGAAYGAAALAVARAGAMSCAELTAVGLPAVLVPYPFAADDHQRHNAEALVAAGAAEMILDRALDGPRLAAALRGLLADPARRARMAAAARALGRPEAAARVAEECLALAERVTLL
jgi:UDP-N-acetylglucosamine--N-acetylmuramyl-(pentapeptide) pyrophosphoryl-undecaprenol N-acetylglucosamine transferase